MDVQNSQIYLQGVTLEQFKTVILHGVEERLKELVKTPEKEEVKYLTRFEVAKLLSISLPTLHDWSRKKILNPYRMGCRVYFKSDEIEKSLKRINQN